MKTAQSPYACVLTVFLSASLCAPSNVAAAPDTAERAGEVSRVIPSVNIARSGKKMIAAPKTVVDWLDVVNTEANARARVALDDGSVLNLGADSSIKVVKHDGTAQQTELEMAFGKIRSQAQKITQANGKFEVKTPAGVAGVVGTDFYSAFDPSTGTMTVIVYEGLVKVCNNAGVCVMVKPGQMTNVRSNETSGPTPPSQAPLDMLVEAGTATVISTPPPPVVAPLSTGAAVGLGALAAAPIIFIPIAATRPMQKAPPTPPPTKGGGCPTPAAGCGGG